MRTFAYILHPAGPPWQEAAPKCNIRAAAPGGKKALDTGPRRLYHDAGSTAFRGRKARTVQPQGHISTWRFVLPVAVENAATTLIGMAYSALIGGVSGSAIAAASTSNTFVTLLTSAFTMLTTGAAVLVARHVGARDNAAASRTMEQSFILSAGLSLCLSALVIALARPIARMLTPGADSALFGETAAYLRAVMLSFPFLALYNILVSTLRAAGNSRVCMLATVAMNLVQLACAWLFLNVLRMGMIGAALAYVCCRCFGAAVIFAAAVRGGGPYHIHLPNLLRPDRAEFRTITRVGAPVALEQVSIQTGYLIANTLAVGLGTAAASVYSITNTINALASIPQSVCTVAAMTIVGQYIGARDREGARRSAYHIWLACSLTCIALGLVMALLGERVTRLYTRDADIARECARMLWVMLGYQFVTGSINSVDPALKVGGEQRFVMVLTSACVWLIRLPLTWLLAYVLHMGVMGVMIANIVSLTARAAGGLWKRHKGDWIHDAI